MLNYASRLRDVQAVSTTPGSFLVKPLRPLDYPAQPGAPASNAALGAFRDWMEQVYLKDRLPKYLDKHEKQGKLPKQFTATAVAAIAGRKRPRAIL